ncbi:MULTISPECIES: winged helix-turn-helix domain-containing protein [unclassified Haloferax]|uniref:ArsR/SmtB family transcription factor n=1 Tax=unclassified Haloferax TaxID=2625095 RepID=UPI00287602EC|nr:MULTISPECIES: winged helix-turn-helix domain-containing protein [unclassified Haloferax]MDS0243400.1 winged helix-turn-helix domain-containing protein [Haloferax sp. S2CR25]MDS0446521.1 winged helix-turn-helix domain-containing protein [Haloferax sp. S2CR25-2]
MSLIGETKLRILLELVGESKHGYQIADELNISKGGVYNHLQDLQEAGMVELVDEQESGRGKKTYKITENGLLLLEALGER